MKKENLRRFNIQLFAENPPDGEGDKPPVITQADLDKAVANANKFKLANDKLAHENAEFKKSQKEKLTAEEQAKQAAEENLKTIADLKKSLSDEKIGKSLATHAFNEEQSKSFLDALGNDDPVERANGVLEVMTQKVKEAVDAAKIEFNTSTQLPPKGNGKDGEKTESDLLFDQTHGIS